jgi:hypothetical protein
LGKAIVRAWSGERGFLIIIILISCHNISDFLLPWVGTPITVGIEMQTYKVAGLSIYYRGRINEYQSKVDLEETYYRG